MTISADDVVVVKDRYLMTVRSPSSSSSSSQQRFFIKGIAFPDSPPERTTEQFPHIQYNVTGWIAILKQLRESIPSSSSSSSSDDALNTIRMYQLDADVDYSEFYEAAAHLNFYIILPLTSNGGDAVLDRSLKAPKCYPPELYQYGKAMIDSALKHPNVLAGVIGNEVMNSLESWYAAPCIKAYAHDLKLYMDSLRQQIQTNTTLQKRYSNRTITTSDDEVQLPSLPLMYAAQDSGIGAALNDVDVIRLTTDYLSCSNNDSNDDDDDAPPTTGSIDIMGVNVESWCATRDTFQYNDDGTIGTFYQLFVGMYSNVGVPLVFSELGCSHSFYNRDTPELRAVSGGTRDWFEIPVVLNGEMSDTWSGFCAYAYWGNSLFNMMSGGPWNGNDPLQPTQDFINFQNQCLLSSSSSEMATKTTTNNDANSVNDASSSHDVQAGSLHDLPMANGGIMEQYYQMLENSNQAPTCSQVEQVLAKTANLHLPSLDDLPSYYSPSSPLDLLASSRNSPLTLSSSPKTTTNNQTTTTPLQNDSSPQHSTSIWDYLIYIAAFILGWLFYDVLKGWYKWCKQRYMYERVPDHPAPPAANDDEEEAHGGGGGP